MSHLASGLGYQKKQKNLMYLEEASGARSGPTAAWVSWSCTRNRKIDFCVEGKIGRCRVADGPWMGEDDGGKAVAGRTEGRTAIKPCQTTLQPPQQTSSRISYFPCFGWTAEVKIVAAVADRAMDRQDDTSRSRGSVERGGRASIKSCQTTLQPS